MLNEKAELEELKNPETLRLHLSDHPDSLKGVKRILTLYARYCFYDHEPQMSDNQTTEALKQLFIEPEADVQKDHLYDGAIFRYYQRKLGKDEACRKKMTQALKWFNERKPFFKQKRNELDISVVLNEAKQAGPLKNLFLVCGKADILDKKILVKNKEYRLREYMKLSGNGKMHMDRILKYTAACLLGRKGFIHTEPDFYAPIVKTDIMQWGSQDSKGKRKGIGIDPNDIEAAVYEGKSIFKDMGSLYGQSSNSILKVNTKWMEDFGWELMDEDTLREQKVERPSILYYGDSGCGSFLVEKPSL